MAKAVGIKGDYLPDVVDATAGLGRDAFVLASVGCRVRMLERNPVVAALLDDGGAWLCGCGNRRLVTGTFAVDSRLQSDGAERYHPRPQVVYLDPMFPHKQKSALVKKRCACFSRWWGRILMPMDCWSLRGCWQPNAWW